MLKELLNMANNLDNRGFSKEADMIDNILRKIASGDNEDLKHMFDIPPDEVEFEDVPELNKEDEVIYNTGKNIVNFIGHDYGESYDIAYARLKEITDLLVDCCDKNSDIKSEKDKPCDKEYAKNISFENNLECIIYEGIKDLTEKREMLDISQDYLETGLFVKNYAERMSGGAQNKGEGSELGRINPEFGHYR